jgi:hypothetical protein
MAAAWLPAAIAEKMNPRLDPLTHPAPAEESAVTGHPLSPKGERARNMSA